MAEDDGLLKARKVANAIGCKFTGGVTGLVASFQHGNRTKEVRVEKQIAQTLFVKSNGYNNFPQILDEYGEDFVVTFIDGAITSDDVKEAQADNDQDVKALAAHFAGLAKSKSLEKIAKYAKEANMKLALVKLEKGYMIDNMGVIYTNITTKGTQRKIIKEFIYTNEGLKIEVLKGRNFGGVREGASYSTKPMDQIKAMSRYGFKAKAWTILSKTSKNLTNLFDAAQLVLDLGNDNRSFSSIPGFSPLAAGVAALGMIGDVEWGKLDQDIDKLILQEIENNKKEGLAKIKSVVNKYVNKLGRSKAQFGVPLDPGEFVYYLRGISKDTASKLLTGELKTIEDLFLLFDDGISPEVVILLKKVGHPDFVDTIYIIETFYIIKK